MSKQQQFTKLGDVAFNRAEKVNSELFTLTYGALVYQLLKDYEDVDEVNKQLDKMGFNMGQRMVDEFLAKSGISQKCSDFKESCEVLAKVGFKMFLGVSADIGGWNNENTECSLTIAENPLIEFVELSYELKGLWYSNLLCGIIRGALEMLNTQVSTQMKKCMLHGDEINEIRISLIEEVQETYVADDE
eukprot:c15296_g1_i1.p1 GENE.c15296_g1_i1~~c15296_g1_i1.p1  ORF type:complete len:189 (+),score=80.55 c15296_g1_i1:50-616(+)